MNVALDTNALVDFLTDDKPERAAQVKILVAAAQQQGVRIFLPLVVISETAWVLRKLGADREAVREALRGVVDAAVFDVERADDVRQALDGWTTRSPGFADLLILAVCERRPAMLYTSDAALVKRGAQPLHPA